MEYKLKYMELVGKDKIKKVVPSKGIYKGFYGYKYIGIPVEVMVRKGRYHEGFFFVDHLNKFSRSENPFLAHTDVDYEKTIQVNIVNKQNW